jgi:hypothetical protein
MSRAMTLDDFRPFREGSVLVLHTYRLYRDAFVWLHDRVEGDRVYGTFVNSGDMLSSAPEVDGYLYEMDGVVCCGSSAARVYDDPPEEDQGED